MSGAVWGEIANAALQVGSAWLNADAQRGANRTNRILQRRQQDWEAYMSNTAVRRRADDIEAAGGNRALAFTNGQEASTPSVSAPQMQAPTFAPIRTNFTAAMLAKSQIANVNSQTAVNLAEARSKTVDANIREQLSGLEKETKANKYVEEGEQQNLKTKIMRSMDINTAAQAKVAEKTVDALVARAAQDAAKGALNLEALKNIASMHGIEAGMLAPILKMITQFFLAYKD